MLASYCIEHSVRGRDTDVVAEAGDMRVHIKYGYRGEWARLLKFGTIETDGNTPRYFARVLAENKRIGQLSHFHNGKTKRSLLILKKRRP